MQSCPYAFAARTPVHGATGWGARHRRLPTGGAANGMPLNAITRSLATPSTSPLSIFTRSPAAAPMPCRLQRDQNGGTQNEDGRVPESQ